MKILIIRFSSIGDIVLTSPVLRCLSKQTGAEIHFLTKTAFAGLLTENPFLSRVFSFKHSLDEVVPDLKKEKYDLVCDLHNNLRSRILTFHLNRPVRRFSKLNWEKWLLVNFKINRLPNRHIVHRYMDTVAHLGVHYDGKGLDFFLKKEEEKAFERLGNPFFPNQYLAFVIGAAHATKQLPKEKIIEFCRAIERPIVLVGGKGDAEVAEHIVSALPDRIIRNACGQFSIHGSASIIKNARIVLTHDTGMMHIAAAFQKDIVSVWGNTVPAFGMIPFFKDGVNKNITLEVENLPCRPCSKIGHSVCPKGHFRCMKEQKPIKINY